MTFFRILELVSFFHNLFFLKFNLVAFSGKTRLKVTVPFDLNGFKEMYLLSLAIMLILDMTFRL